MAKRSPQHYNQCAPGAGIHEEHFRAWIKTTYDALLVFEAARRGTVPRVTRRFHEAEKQRMIVSGAVLVFTEEESGIKRWTDPFLWTASRMLGNFMIYREREDVEESPSSPYSCSAIVSSPRESELIRDPDLERCIYGSWNRGKGLKANGLMKKTISLLVEGIVYHLVSYYNPSDVLSGKLQSPSSLNVLTSVPLSTEIIRGASQLRHPPRIAADDDGKPVYIGEEESLTSLYSNPLALSQGSPPSYDTDAACIASSPPSTGPIIQPIPRRLENFSFDGAEPIVLDASSFTHDSRIQYLPDSSGFHFHVSHSGHGPERTLSPYSRDKGRQRKLRTRLKGVKSHSERPKLKETMPVASSTGSHGDQTSNSQDASSLLSSPPIPHLYDPSLSFLPTLLGGSQSLEAFYPSFSQSFLTNALSNEAHQSTSQEKIPDLWDSMGGSANWVYEGQSQVPRYTC